MTVLVVVYVVSIVAAAVVLVGMVYVLWCQR